MGAAFSARRGPLGAAAAALLAAAFWQVRAPPPLVCLSPRREQSYGERSR